MVNERSPGQFSTGYIRIILVKLILLRMMINIHTATLHN